MIELKFRAGSTEAYNAEQAAKKNGKPILIVQHYNKQENASYAEFYEIEVEDSEGNATADVKAEALKMAHNLTDIHEVPAGSSRFMPVNNSEDYLLQITC